MPDNCYLNARIRATLLDHVTQLFSIEIFYDLPDTSKSSGNFEVELHSYDAAVDLILAVVKGQRSNQNCDLVHQSVIELEIREVLNWIIDPNIDVFCAEWPPDDLETTTHQ